MTEQVYIYNLTAFRQLSQMFLALAFFHSSEYMLAIAIHGKPNVTFKSPLVSKSYLVSVMFSFVEYVVEILVFPQLKEYWWISNVGLLMVIAGEIIRKIAIITAGSAFTLTVRTNREEHHKLVTHGIYKFVRHPGYLGYLLWSVGMQIMICNIFSTIEFSVVVWRFFSQRVPYEEGFLRRFFGTPYEEYARRTPSGLPFVK